MNLSSFSTTHTLHPLVFRIAEYLPVDLPIYLVGGAVRDLLLGRELHDLDFALPGGVIRTARNLADRLGADFYPLDAERDTARLFFNQPGDRRWVLDFAAYRGEDLLSDLRGRDFSINAIAIDIRKPSALIDPMGGAADLHAGRLRACSSNSFEDDPVRILRGARLSAALKMKIEQDTLSGMRRAVNLLDRVSPERLRDELFRILDTPQPGTALRVADAIGALQFVLPEFTALKGISQSPPHISDVWDHTLDVLNRLEALLQVLSQNYDPDQASNLMLGLAVLRIGRYREKITENLKERLNLDRSHLALLRFAALHHDIGKAQTRQVDEAGRIRFFEHERVGAELSARRGEALRLSNLEVERLQSIVRFHLRPLLLAQGKNQPSPRAIYRYFRDAGPASVDVCLLALADVLATYGHTLTQEIWIRQLDVIRTLFEALWERPEQSVFPPVLLNGRDLMEAFGLHAGPLIGELLEAVREAQAVGQVSNRDEALSFAERILAEDRGNRLE